MKCYCKEKFGIPQTSQLKCFKEKCKNWKEQTNKDGLADAANRENNFGG